MKSMETVKPMKQWLKEAVVYQIYPRSFLDTNGDGIGDLPGITAKLDYLRDLGVTVLWLSPVYASPNDDNGYDISDYYAVNPEFGTMADMTHLLAEAKARGIRIIMDLVINHTSIAHAWFQASRDPNSPYRDYYFWREGRPGGLPPNNWTSFFGGGAWERDETQNGPEAPHGWYFLHLFSARMPDLNLGNEQVVREVMDIMRFWLDKGVAGFRCDVINIIGKRALLDGKKRLTLTGREHYLSTERCHALLKRFRTEVFNQYDCFTVGETVLVTPAMANDLCAPERGELDMVFSFAHMETEQINNKWFKKRFKPHRLFSVLETWQKSVDWNANYFENHDQPRSVSRFGNDGAFRYQSATSLATLLFALRGTPFVYMGQEIGMTNGDFTDMSEIRDNESIQIDALAKRLHFPAKYRWKLIKRTSRDNARTPMQWNTGPHAGFTHTGFTHAGDTHAGFSAAVDAQDGAAVTAAVNTESSATGTAAVNTESSATPTPWLKVNGNARQINVEADEASEQSIIRYYRRLIALRKTEKALIDGRFERLPAPSEVFLFQRIWEDDEKKQERIVVACSLANGTRTLFAPLSGELMISNYNRESANKLPVLQPYEALMLRMTM